MIVFMLFLIVVTVGCFCDGINFLREYDAKITATIYFAISAVAGFYALKFWLWAIFY